MDNSIMYLVVRTHGESDGYPEDEVNYADDYLGVFDNFYEADCFMKALPLKGQEYTSEFDYDSAHKRVTARRFKNEKDDEVTTEYWSYVIKEVIHY